MAQSNLTTRQDALVVAAAEPTALEIRMDETRFPRLRQYPLDLAVENMKAILLAAYTWRGQAASETTVNFIAMDLIGELAADREHIGTRDITFEEIRRELKAAILSGREMYGISVASVYQVITDYIRNEGKELQKKVELQKNAVTREYTEMRQALMDKYTEAMFQNTKIK